MKALSSNTHAISNGEQRIEDIRRYLDLAAESHPKKPSSESRENVSEKDHEERKGPERDSGPLKPTETRVGSSTANTHHGFQDWVASFTGGVDEEEDKALIQAFKEKTLDNRHQPSSIPFSETSSESIKPAEFTTKSEIHLIITNLRKTDCPDSFTEQIFTHSNRSVHELLQHLRSLGQLVVPVVIHEIGF